MRKLAVVLGALVLLAGAAGYLFYVGTLRFNTPSRADFPVWGIDVSHHQGTIDWARVRSSGMDFAYVKASEGGDFRDDTFGVSWRAARAAGIPRGAYHFFTLCRTGEEQANNFIAAVGDDMGELPPVIDAEFVGNCAKRPPVNDVAGELATMVTLVRQRFGRPPVLYVTYEFYDLYLEKALLTSPLWIRDIWRRPHLPEGRGWLFWQFHNRGAVDGVTGPVDLNVFNGSREAFADYVELDEVVGPEDVADVVEGDAGIDDRASGEDGKPVDRNDWNDEGD